MNRRTMRMLAIVTSFAVVAAANNATAAEDGVWEGSLSASLTAQTGSNDTLNGSIDAEANRDTEENEVGVRFNATYGQTRGTEDAEKDKITQNSQALFGDWKRIVHEGLFWDTRSEVSRDTIQNREARAAVSVGPGYRVWNGDDAGKQHFDLAAGVGYRFELIETPSTGDGDNYDPDHFSDIVASFEYKNLLFDGRVEYTHTGSIKVPANSPSAWVARSEVIGSVPLSDAWSLRVSVLAEYQNTVPDDTNELLTRTNLGLTYSF